MVLDIFFLILMLCYHFDCCFLTKKALAGMVGFLGEWVWWFSYNFDRFCLKTETCGHGRSLFYEFDDFYNFDRCCLKKKPAGMVELLFYVENKCIGGSFFFGMHWGGGVNLNLRFNCTECMGEGRGYPPPPFREGWLSNCLQHQHFWESKVKQFS